MRFRTLAVAVGVVAAAAVCVRLGFWQIDRLHQKQALNREQKRALALPPFVVLSARLPAASLNERRVLLVGTFDERHQVLLAGRAHDGAPGVHVVTPLVLARGTGTVLVDRGWIPSPDAARARPQDVPEPGLRRIVGMAFALRRGTSRPVRVLESDSVTVFSASELNLDALSGHMPYSLASFGVRALPAPDDPKAPVREPERPYDETMHVSYAIQWFTFAAILVFGSMALAWSRRKGAGPSGSAAPIASPGR